jgi:hypothetical protein
VKEEKVRTGRLLSDLCSPDESVKWAAVLAMGAYVSNLAQNNLEAGRNWMRRFMWQLNEESGGIGWGVAEVMGEVMARHEILAREFVPILISYLDEDGNYLEFEPLQIAVLWAMGRLAQVRPELLKDSSAPRHVERFLHSSSAPLRGLAVWVLGWIGKPESLPLIQTLVNDPTEISLFNGKVLETRSIQILAWEAAKEIGS